MSSQQQKSEGLKPETIFSRLNNILFARRNEKVNATNYCKESHELIQNINNALQDWICSSNNFEFAKEFYEVDYYIYEMKANQLKYEHLLRIAKEKGIRANYWKEN